jgi:hypothetical protein
MYKPRMMTFRIDADQSCRPISAVEIVASSLKSVP